MPDTPTLTWFKSTHSGGAGGDCVEVAVQWATSSYSGDGGANCVEVARTPAAVHIRDSKDPNGGTLTVDRDTWAAFIAFARRL
ncbi:DUF397 domain-containing protein [Streptomyces sp. PTM05]|uniref:DUF397 domain-containing protein n=1 Tax=Streptantibioticus parmotrematis TaxID=2873249 RepID=A0ABS7R040_9ACTN|nr:DUF397 domain-containing protein [Streptantibioticus parmotrematis]MBY8888834.1 DUF397 domain-containing protein [Streptantibioticus parmotrematis]